MDNKFGYDFFEAFNPHVSHKFYFQRSVQIINHITEMRDYDFEINSVMIDLLHYGVDATFW